MTVDSNFLLAIGAIVTAIVAVINSFSTSRKSKGDAAASISQGYGGLIDDYQEQLRTLKEDNALLQDKVTKLRSEVLELQLKLSQALERISVLEGENEVLQGGDY